MPEVYNRRAGHAPAPQGAVYVGRGTKWGNPFIIGKDGDRGQVIRLFEEYLLMNGDLLDDLHELQNKDLVCWCAPLACHADVLMKHANHREEM